MFCPECGLNDTQVNQFCRACGSDLRTVRLALAKPDQITASAVSARDEIGRAVAAKIRQVPADELSSLVEEVLPEVEKFLESPEEKRLRRIRNGTVVSAIGVGVAIAMSIVAMASAEADLMFLAGIGMVTFFLGIGLIINGIFLTLPKRTLPGGGNALDTDMPGELEMPETTPVPGSVGSVTEHTTRDLRSGPIDD